MFCLIQYFLKSIPSAECSTNNGTRPQNDTHTHSTLEYRIFVFVRLLCIWNELRFINQGDLESRVTGGVYYTGFNAFLSQVVGASTKLRKATLRFFIVLRFLNSAAWYTCVSRTNKMHSFFFINDLIQLYFLRHVSNIKVFIIRKTVQATVRYFYHASVQRD